MKLDEYLIKELNMSKNKAYEVAYAVEKFNENKKKRSLNIRIPKYTLGEELFNAISHGIGAIFAIVALVLMVIKANTALEEATVALFGTAMIILYTISCVYHALPASLEGKKVLRVIDHCNVFLLVYGTYIPISLAGIGGIKGFILFGIVTVVTITGITVTAIKIDKTQVLQVICHLLCGWSALIFIPALVKALGINGLISLILGGVMYSVGSILYGLGKKKKNMHSIFHIFCLLGTLFHFLCIYLTLLK